MAKLFFGMGLVFLLLGAIFWVAPKVPGLDKLGRLPGDIHFQRDGVKIYFPWVSCLVISGMLTLLFQLWRLFKK